jgi:hypothetical protein
VALKVARIRDELRCLHAFSDLAQWSEVHLPTGRLKIQCRIDQTGQRPPVDVGVSDVGDGNLQVLERVSNSGRTR